MTDINAEHWKRLQPLMHQALDLPPAERAAFIAQLDDADIAKSLTRLLQAAEKPDPLLDSDAGSLLAGLIEPTPGDPAATPADPRHFGIYQVDRPLGQGGMGQVFLAHRSDGTVTQQVAIKVLHAGGADAGLRRRLLEEMQVLSGLEHPGIVRFIDGGVDQGGVPYLVMEYCKGERIDAWCRRTRPGIERRLQLLIELCDAVEHAHQHLVVHRDIKPSNILVDDEGCPKLLDFGVAKVLQGDGVSDTGSTRVFSPGYAAPEQTSGTGITTATDVYALSVLLGELLWGPLPAPDANATHLDPPLLRWRKGLKQAMPDEIAQLARRRRISVRHAAHMVQGDLARIVAKGLRSEPGQRYHSARLLAEDLKNYLAHRPVAARHGGWSYRSRRFLRRNAIATTLALGSVLGMLGATGAALYQAQQARAAAVQAGIQARRAGAVNDFLQSVFDAADPMRNQGKDIPVSQLLNLAVARSKTQLKGDPEVRGALLTSLGQVLYNVGRFRDAAQLQSEAVELYRASHANAADLANALRGSGTSQMRLGKLNQARKLLEEAVRLTPLSGQWTPIAVQTRGDLGYLLVDRLNGAKSALALLEPMLARQDAITRLGDGQVLLSEILQVAAGAYLRQGKFQKAIDTGLRAARIKRLAYGSNDVRVAQSLSYVAAGYDSLGNFQQSANYDKKIWEIDIAALGAEHPDTIGALNDVATDDLAAGRAQQALERMQQVVASFRKSYGEKSQYVAVALSNIGEAQRQLGEFAKAARSMRTALDINIAKLGDAEPATALSRALYARALGEAGHLNAAAPAFKRGLSDLQTAYGKDHPITARMGAEYGLFLIHSERLQPALAQLSQARAALLKTYAASDLYPSLAQLYLGLAYAKQQQTGQARKLLQQALPIVQAAGPKYHRVAAEGKAALKKLANR